MYITTHVINAQFIWHLLSYRVRTIIRTRLADIKSIYRVPCDIIDVIAAGIFITKAVYTTTSCIFPLCLGGHTEPLT